MRRNCSRTGLDTARLCSHHISPLDTVPSLPTWGPWESPGLRGDAAGARPPGSGCSSHRPSQGQACGLIGGKHIGIPGTAGYGITVYSPPTECFNFVQINKHLLKGKVAQSCPALCDPMDYTVHGILQVRILEWVAVSLLQGIFPTQGLIPGLPRCRWILYQLSHKGSPRILEWVAYPFSRGSS